MSSDKLNDPKYASLREVLDLAYEQAASGKGHERHGNGLPFDEQPMQTICRDLGSSEGMAFQVTKKVLESYRLPTLDAKVRELLGAINYIAGMIIFEKRKFNQSEDS